MCYRHLKTVAAILFVLAISVLALNARAAARRTCSCGDAACVSTSQCGVPAFTDEKAVCGAKCISLPYDGGTCTKPASPFHEKHRCSKGHTWP